MDSGRLTGTCVSSPSRVRLPRRTAPQDEGHRVLQPVLDGVGGDAADDGEGHVAMHRCHEEPTHAEPDEHRLTSDWQPCYVTPVPAVNPRGGVPAPGAYAWRSAACRVDQRIVLGDHDLPHHDVQARKENLFQPLRLHNDVVPWRNGPAIHPVAIALP